MPAVIENLEQRQYFVAIAPTSYETYLVELVNRARANPTLEATRQSINLNEGLNAGQITTTPKQPYAYNGFLTSSAAKHALYMLQTGQITLVGANGTIPADRMLNEGYLFTGTVNGSAEDVTALVQDTTFPNDLTPYIDTIFKNLFVDGANANRPNRTNMLAESLKEVGAGIYTGDYGPNNGGGQGGGNTNGPQGLTAVLDMALATSNANGDVFLTGVAYDDISGDNFYSPYVQSGANFITEGLGNVTVSARNISTNATFTTTTYNSGAYSLRLTPGTYDVIATGTTLGGSVRYPAVVIGSKNVKRDFTTQQAGSTVPTPGTNVPPPTVNPISRTGDLRGKVYLDLDGDGRRDNEQGGDVLSGIRVYVDNNKNGRLDAGDVYGVTQANGAYRITGLQPGVYTLRVDTPDGFRVSIPSGDGSYQVKVTSQKQRKVNSIALTEQTLIAGRVYRDDNANGVFDPTVERGRSNWRVFIDLNNDGVWQREIEPATKTDKEGKYSFRDLLPGSYTIRVVPKAGYLQTEPATGGYTVQLNASGIGVRDLNFGERRLT
ncbi:MAG TPA: SdrD B-like domain-containing protein [Humisphaera sp.]